jgi:hypothetical protein
MSATEATATTPAAPVEEVKPADTTPAPVVDVAKEEAAPAAVSCLDHPFPLCSDASLRRPLR